MRIRRTAAVAAAALALGAAGCGGPDRQVADVPDGDRPTPDTTPFIEPVSPPAQEAERPEDQDVVDDG